MKRVIFVSALILSTFDYTSRTFAQRRTYINPGIKLEYTCGQNGGFTYGVEVSYILEYSEYFAGAVFDLDICNGRTRTHFGLEIVD